MIFIFYFYVIENDNLFLEGGAIAPNSSPQLRH